MAVTKRERHTIKSIKKAYVEYDVEKQVEIEDALDFIPEIDIEDDTEPRIFAVKKVHQMYEDNEDVSEIEKVVGLSLALSKEMEDAIKEFKDTPLEEPAFEDINDGLYEIAEYIEERSGIKRENYSQEQYMAFCGEISKKIASMTDENGNMKATPEIKKLGLILSGEVKPIVKFMDEEDHTKKVNGVISVLKKSRKNINCKDRGEWEKALLVNNIR